MEPPLEREGKGVKVSIKKVEKSSYEQRLQLTRTVFQLFSFFKKQTTVCSKKKPFFVQETFLKNGMKSLPKMHIRKFEEQIALEGVPC